MKVPQPEISNICETAGPWNDHKWGPATIVLFDSSFQCVLTHGLMFDKTLNSIIELDILACLDEATLIWYFFDVLTFSVEV